MASQSDPSAFSVRIVSIDYYMSPPIPDIDICYSSFQGGKVEEVPVIRIYGPTLSGQKTCLHVHRALPYFYVPCSDVTFQNPQEGHAYTEALSHAIEKALMLKSSSGSKRQHVHGCSLVRAKKFYGYHSSEELFVKIHLYYPHEVSRAASLLLEGAVFGRSFQPYESHIPYLLQFLIDYNLYGMGHVHVSKIKFRDPQPSHYTGKFTYDSPSLQAESSGEASRGLLSLSPTVPSDPTTNGHDAFGNQTSHSVKRQSICELEGDSVLDDILNQQLKMYTSLSQSSAEVKMVQSLLPIWEEYERTGMQEASKSVDVSKPLPENVLRSFLSDIEFMNAFLELCSDRNCSTREATHLVVKPTAESGKSLAVSQHIKATSSSGECMKEEFKSENASDDDIHTEKIKECHVPLPNGKQILSSSLKESPDPEVNDIEALGLLGWLASSQAAEDLNLDYELVHEAILSPLLPKNTFGEVLEKACLDYESASQQECQDILDSVEVDVQDKSLTAQAESNVDCRNMICSSKKVIPQVDGSCGDQFETLQMAESSETNVDSGGKKLSSDQMKKGAEPLLRSKNKRNRLLWGVLPICPREKASDDLEYASASSTEITAGKFKVDTDSASSSGSEVDKSNDSSKFDRDNCHLREEKLLNRCSTRDLMRRKRHSRVERSGDEALKIKKLAPEALRPDWKILNPDIGGQKAQNDLETSGAGRCAPGAFEQGCRLVLDDCNSTRIMELPSSSFSDLSMRFNMSLKEFVSYHEGNNERESTGAPVESPCLKSTAPPLLHAALRLMPDSINSNQPGTDAYRSFCARCKVEKNSESCQCTSEFAGAGTCSNDLSFIDSSKLNLDKTVEGLYQGQTLALTSLTDFTDKCTASHQANNITNNSQAEEGLPVQFDNHREGNLRFQLNYLQTKDHSSGEHDLHVDKGRSCIEYIEMTFNRKAPTRDQIKSSCESSVMATVHNRDSVGSLSNPSEALVCNNSVFDSGRQHIDDLHPFFINNFKKEERVDAYQTKETHFTPRKIVQGVPTHFQNDGSLLYLLTPALAPPSLECVNQWLRNSEQNSLGLNKGISSDCFHEEQGKSSMKADLCLKTNNDCLHDVQKVQQIQEQIASFEAETNLKHTNHVMGKSQTGDIQMKVKKCTENLQEVSQISGPDEKSKLTPLSQIGFRDPASVGAGQQLTMVSIEVQTESRGDFRPDPQFDAVNIIALVVQGDNDDTFEVYVLLRAKDGELSGRSIDGVSNCKFVNFLEERQLLHHFVNIICSCDPDILMGWEIQGGSLGFLAERAAHLGIGLLKNISRATVIESKPAVKNSASPEERADDMLSEVLEVDPVAHKDTVIEDEWGRTHASGIHVSGRIVLNIWRLMRAELKLNMYTLEAVTEAVLRLKVPSIPIKILNQWFSTGPERARFRSIDYILKRAKLNLQIMNQLDMINRTSELARIFGIDFFSVLSRGSQYRVESMLLRLAHTQNYLCISPGSHQVSSQPAMECLPLVMEPESGFYTDPVIVLDFQSLYPSMIIGYNLCFSTCLGKVLPSKENVLGVSSYSAEPQLLRDLFQQILLTPNGVMYVPSKVQKGVLPRLLEEILSTRIMVKQAMKKLMPSEQVLHRVFNARQLALKLIANVTYGYTAAGFSGRMPCAELADSIVQCGRRTLEKAILFVNTHETWRARVIYGDTDSMFVLLKGRSMEEAFRIGHEIASSVTAMNPSPVTLKMEKVYQPCVLLTKKRYVGYSYESPDQGKPVFDAKGIETVRRDTCPAVAKALEHSLRILFEEQDILKVKFYLERQWTRILSGKISIQDFVFAKEVRLGTYSVRSSSLPPAAIVATKAMRADPRAEPLHGERVPYVVIHGEPGARLVDMVLNPLDFLQMNSPYRLNDLYYINKQIIPALQRVFGLVGADLNQWFLDMPRPIRSTLAKRHYNQSSRGSVKSRIDNYYLSKHCALCGKLVQASSYLCEECSIKEPIVTTALIGRTSKLERDIHHLSAICRHCGGGDWITESGVKCTSLSCSVFYERRKVQKELQALSTVATDKRFYPTCMAEWF